MGKINWIYAVKKWDVNADHIFCIHFPEISLIIIINFIMNFIFIYLFDKPSNFHGFYVKAIIEKNLKKKN